MRTQRTLLSSALAMVLLCSTTVLQAGVPVIDGAANTLLGQQYAQQMQQDTSTVAQWGKEITQWANQLQAYEKQYNDLRSGNYAGLISDFGGTFFTEGGAVSGMLYGSYSDSSADQAASKYLGDQNNACQGSTDSMSGANYQTCKTARNLQAKAMSDMDDMLKQAQKRTEQIQALINDSHTGDQSPGRLQQKTIEMMGLQALLQNDLAKLQLTIEMHKQREKLYQQQQADNLTAMLGGNGKSASLSDALVGLGDGFQPSLN